MTPPATPLFPSLEMEANSSQMIYQKELPILQPVRTSRFSSKSDAASTSTRSESPTSSSSKSVTPTERPGSSSRKNLNTAAAALPKEQDSAYRIDKRSSYTPLTNRQHNSIPAARTSATKASKMTLAKKPAGPGSANAVKNVAKPDKAPKNIATSSTKARLKDSSVGGKDQKAKIDAGPSRRLSCPPAATMGSNGDQQLESVQDTVAARGRSRTGTGNVPSTRKGVVITAEAIPSGRRRAGGEKEQRLKLGSHAKK